MSRAALLPATSTTATLLLLLLLFASRGVSAQGATFAEPPSVTPDANGLTELTLTVGEGVLSVPGAFSMNSRVYYYNGQVHFPGPTIHMKPGGTLKIHLQNRLASSADVDAGRTMNEQLYLSNETNIHTHGLHVSADQDDIFIHLKSGEDHTYTYTIPANHQPGTHWYHDHIHGATGYHVSGGLVGQIVVDPPADAALPTSLSGLTHHMFAIHRFVFADNRNRRQGPGGGGGGPGGGGGGGGGNNCPAPDPTIDQYSTLIGNTMTHNIVHSSGTAQDYYTVNGQYIPKLSWAADERHVLQIIYSGSANPILRAPSCTLHQLSADGVYLTAVRAQTSIRLHPAKRADVAILCESATDTTIDITIANSAIATVALTGSSSASQALPDLAAVTVPSYIADLSSATATTTGAIHVAQGGAGGCLHLLGIGTNCDDYDGNVDPSATHATCPSFAMPGSRGTDPANHRFVATVGDIVNMNIHGSGNANAPHPVHIHVNHFQIISYTGNNDINDFGVYVGEWRDTVPALPGKLLVRFRADTFAGETVTHCHILSHEDTGLMGSFLIQNASSSSTSTTGTPATPPPTATATPSGTTSAPATSVPATLSPVASSGASPALSASAIVVLAATLLVSALSMLV